MLLPKILSLKHEAFCRDSIQYMYMYITYWVLTMGLGGNASLDEVNVIISPHLTEILLVLYTYSCFFILIIVMYLLQHVAYLFLFWTLFFILI